MIYKESKYPLLSMKLYAPPVKSSMIHRKHLLDRLKGGLNHKLTLVSAPAGFGKTSLLSEWIATYKSPAAWITLDKTDNDPVYFIRYLICALQNIKKDIGKSILPNFLSFQSESVATELILSGLIQEIDEIKKDFVLILDDYHHIDNPIVHSYIEFLIKHLPLHSQLIIATRIDPPFPLAGFKVRGEMTELRFSDLCFKRDEILSFFKNRLGINLSNTEISVLEARTEGWIAGLQMAALSMKAHDDIPAFIKLFSGDDRHIVDYLAEEVLNLQQDYIHQFLLQTSILDRLSGELCDFITGRTDSQQIIIELEKANIFIVPLDGKRRWYRYHHLFGDLLRQRLTHADSALVSELHAKASLWFENNQLLDIAIDHAFASGDFKRAAHLLDRLVNNARGAGNMTRLLTWLEKVPETIIFKHPNLCFQHAVALFNSGRFESAKKKLDKINKRTEAAQEKTSKDTDSAHPMTKRQIQGNVAAIRALMAAKQGNADDIIKFSTLALKLLPPGSSMWRDSVSFSLGITHSIKGNMIDAINALSGAKADCKASATTNLHFYLTIDYWLIVSLVSNGQLKKAIQHCQKTMNTVKENKIEHTMIGSAIFVLWGGFLYEMNELDEALSIVTRNMSFVEQGYDTGHIAIGYFNLMRILTAKNDISGADDIIRKMDKLKARYEVPYWATLPFDVWKTKLWLIKGKYNDVSLWMEKHSISLNNKPAPLQETAYILFARLLMIRGKTGDALNLLNRLLKGQKKGKRHLSRIETLLVKAAVLEAEGEMDDALVTMSDALRLAKPGGFIRIFLDEGPFVAGLLEQTLESKIKIPEAFTKKLLTAFKINKHMKLDEDLTERLSDRETEVLRLIAAGLPNKKITEALFISLSTVKTHIQNIYSKLSVHSRTEAILKAKQKKIL